jgi:hypothetical protein
MQTTTSTQQYTVNSMKKLVDLNADMINFVTNFTAKSTNNEEFECLVVDQATLDNNSDLQYKKVPGIISGSVSSDKNVYQNYYLILRSDTPCTVDVSIESQHLDDVLNINTDTQPVLHQQQLVEPIHPPHPPPDLTQSDNSIFKNWKTMVAIASICLVVYFVLIKNNYPSSPPTNSTHSSSSSFSSTVQVATPVMAPLPTPPISAFAEKLKELKI